MLDKVKLALRISTDAFDSELSDLIEAAKLDLGVAGVRNSDLEPGDTSTDALISRAIVLYCKLYFSEPPTAEHWNHLKLAYDEQKAQLGMASGYTDWGGNASE
jgi:uncharacterized phage protein (predicted DNA packaging)